MVCGREGKHISCLFFIYLSILRYSILPFPVISCTVLYPINSSKKLRHRIILLKPLLESRPETRSFYVVRILNGIESIDSGLGTGLIDIRIRGLVKGKEW